MQVNYHLFDMRGKYSVHTTVVLDNLSIRDLREYLSRGWDLKTYTSPYRLSKIF
jgi:hypothetical protein